MSLRQTKNLTIVLFRRKGGVYDIFPIKQKITGPKEFKELNLKSKVESPDNETLQ